jgi:hypothetical protein
LQVILQHRGNIGIGIDDEEFGLHQSTVKGEP